MGENKGESFDRAEVCELIGLFALNTLTKKFGKENIGLYRDDGLALIKSTSGRLADKAKKDLRAQFLQFDLKITAEVNHQLVNFLDVTFNLKDGSYSPYRKPDNNLLYIDTRSNHPPSITKHLSASINRRISSLPSSKLAFEFDLVANIYEAALHKSNYNGKLEYSPDNPPTTITQKRKRQRNIIWFNPPFSYSCMENVKSSISRHNKRGLARDEPIESPSKLCDSVPNP